MGLGQYYSLGEYCGPHTASSVFLILMQRARAGIIGMQEVGEYTLDSWASIPQAVIPPGVSR